MEEIKEKEYEDRNDMELKDNDKIIDEGVVTGEEVTDDQVTGEQVTDDQVMGEQVTGDQVTGEQVTDDQVMGEEVTDDQVMGEQVTDDQVTGEEVTDDQVMGEQVTDDQVMGEQVTGDQVTGEEVTDDQVTGEQVTGDQVTGKTEVAEQEDRSKSENRMDVDGERVLVEGENGGDGIVCEQIASTCESRTDLNETSSDKKDKIAEDGIVHKEANKNTQDESSDTENITEDGISDSADDDMEGAVTIDEHFFKNMLDLPIIRRIVDIFGNGRGK